MSKKKAISELLEKKNTGLQEPSYTEAQESRNIVLQKTRFTDPRKPVNTEIQKPKKKATFEMNLTLHKELKKFATEQDKKMVEIMEEAVREYLQKYRNTGGIK